MNHHLAEFNVARMVAPLESPELADFVAGLEPINALADRSPGFVWRLQTDDGTATSLRPYDDDLVIVNMSVWESPDALADFVYRSEHRDYLRRRREFFSAMAEAFLVLWWIQAGELPSVEDGIARLERLRAHGPTHHAFTLRARFPAEALDA